MSDILAQMEADLQKYKKDYQQIKKWIVDACSEDGEEISACERENLEACKRYIEQLELSIKERKDLLSRIDFQGVYHEYDMFFKRLQVTVNRVIKHHNDWRLYISQVSNIYNSAAKEFTAIIEAQKQFHQDLVNITTAAISIVGGGMLSWISTTGSVASRLASLSDDVINIAEDVAQITLDKVVSIAGPKIASIQTIGTPDVIEFQNKISIKALEACQPLLKTVIECQEVVLACLEHIARLHRGKGGTVRGNSEAKLQYEKCLSLMNSVSKTMQPVHKWLNIPVPSISPSKLQHEFKSSFFAGWLPRLSSYHPSYQREVPPSTGSFQAHVETVPARTSYENFFFSDRLAEALDEVIDLQAAGIGEGGLDFYISDNDIKLMVAWAKNYQPKHQF